MKARLRVVTTVIELSRSVEGLVAGSVFGGQQCCCRKHVRVPSCSNTALGCSAVRVFIPHGTLYTCSQTSASAAPAYGMVCSHSSMVVSGQGPAMNAENLYGQWVCTHRPNGAQSARMWTAKQHTDWPGGRGVGRPQPGSVRDRPWHNDSASLLLHQCG